MEKKVCITWWTSSGFTKAVLKTFYGEDQTSKKLVTATCDFFYLGRYTGLLCLTVLVFQIPPQIGGTKTYSIQAL